MVAGSNLRARLSSIQGLSPFLQDFFLSAPLGYQIYSLEGRSLAVNQAFLDLFGIEPPPEYCVFEDSIAKEAGFIPLIQRAFAGGKPERLPNTWYNPGALKNVQVEFKRWLAIESTVFPILSDRGKPLFGAFAFKEVTKEANYLSELKESQFLLEKAQEMAKMGSWSRPLTGDTKISWSKNEYSIFGLEPGGHGGTPEDFLKLVHPDDRPLVLNAMKRIFGAGERASQKFRIIRPNGEIRWISDEAVVVPAEADHPDRIIGVTIDITDQKRSEELAHNSQELFRSLFHSEAFGCFLARIDGSVLEANSAFLDITGYSPEDLKAGKISWREMTPDHFKEHDERGLEQLLATGRCNAFEKEYLRKDGHYVPVLVGGSWAGDSRTEVIFYAHDLTDQKRLEQQFQQSQKLESIGRLAGGVAHDFNNILGIVLLQLEELKTDLLENSAQKEKVEKVTTHVKQATRLTKQLLAFGRKQSQAAEAMDLNKVIEEMREMLGRAIHSGIQLNFHLSDSLLPIRADYSQVEQVVLNLLTNASDAILGKGEITIGTQELELSLEDLGRLRLAVGKPGRFVRLSIKDSGTGIPSSDLPHIYEPFFTTKEPGRGTGLGLPTVYGILRQSGGDVRVVTELGKGSTFEAYFPACESPVKEITFQKSSPQHFAKGHASVILLVDDVMELRGLIRSLLTAQGYKVLEASSGTEALRVCEKWPANIDLIVTDVIMPEMTGPAFVSKLEQIRGQTFPVVYISGYAQEELSRYGITEKGQNFLEKPFSPAELFSRISGVLNPEQPESRSRIKF